MINKSLLLLILCLVLCACNTTTEFPVAYTGRQPIANAACADFKAVKVFQTIEGAALASVCTNNRTDYCTGMTVIIKEDWDMMLYDDKLITPPEGKCFVYKDTLTYETKTKDRKTVPVLEFDYEYWPTSAEESDRRTRSRLESTRYSCHYEIETALKRNKKSYEEKKNLKIKGLQWCDCLYNSSLEAWNAGDDASVEEFKYLQQKMNANMKACGEKYPEAITLLNGK